MEVTKWMGVVVVLSSNPSINLLMFSRLFKGRRGKLFGVCVWECVLWIIWRARNTKIFRGEQMTVNNIVEEVKSNIWSWINNRLGNGSTGRFADWSLSPSSWLHKNS